MDAPASLRSARLPKDEREDRIAEALKRGIDLMTLPVEARPLDDVLDRLGAEPPETPPTRF